MQEQLDALREGLARSHRLATLGTIATIIAHEFNNILTPMISYCQLALQAPQDHELAQKALAKALRGAEQAGKIGSSLLGFAGHNDEAHDCELNRVIDEVFHCLARDPKKDGIELTIEVPAECWVHISPIAMQQVLLNLVLNARQAMHRRGGSLRISAADDGQTVMIKVADTGPGIPPHILPTIFQPFVTSRPPVGGSGAAQSKGTGLGLAICRDLVERAEGRIDVQTRQGAGTTFTIELPRGQAPAEPTHELRSAG